MTTFATGAALAAIAIMSLVAAGRSEHAHSNARRMCTDPRVPMFLRNYISLSPIWAMGLLLGGTLLLVPRDLGVWLFVPVIGLFAASFTLSYRVPAPFQPGWLREEIERGTTPVARPDRMDWLLYWLVVPMAILADSVLILILVFDGGSGPSQT